MKYIIADPDKNSCSDLKRILDDNKMLVFQGSFTTLKAAENSIRKEPPDIAFIRLGKAELNAFRLASEIKERNPFSKVIFISSQKENAIEAFEHEADGFILIPFNKKKIDQWLQQNIKSKK
jgi:two-component SAPR family response regulator